MRKQQQYERRSGEYETQAATVQHCYEDTSLLSYKVRMTTCDFN